MNDISIFVISAIVAVNVSGAMTFSAGGAGPPKNGVQFMVKDSKKYASTGWGFAQFDEGKPADAAMQETCFPCHETVKARDFAFNRYAP